MICAKISSKETLIERNKFLNKEPTNFWEFYVNEGATQLVFRIDHFINRLISFLWSKFYYQYSSDDVFSQGRGSERSV